MSSALGFSARRLPILLLLFAFALVFGCDEETTEPKDDALALPALTTPENLISAIEVIYNDKTHSKDDRLAGYASLFDSAFVFHFQEDWPGFHATSAGVRHMQKLGSATWGLEAELAAHEAMFGEQAAGNIYSLELQVAHNPAQDLSPTDPDREDWKEVFATSVYLRLMFNLNDGLEVNGGQAEFKFPPAENGQFKIGDWTDLPRPGLMGGSAVEPTTWGAIKAQYN